MRKNKKRVFLVEDHDQVLEIWSRQGIKQSDVVHVDAHLDFALPQALPVEQVLNRAKSVSQLKKGLETTLAYLDYEKDLSRQTNVGNYLYPAALRGIVRNIYWVIPGSLKTFERSRKGIITLCRSVCQEDALQQNRSDLDRGSLVHFNFRGHDLFVCCLENLPVLKERVLLDIDADFLVIPSTGKALNTCSIGKRKPWISPQELIKRLKEKVSSWKALTIAYSVNGGWTPMEYRYLADEIAYCVCPRDSREKYIRSRKAAGYFKRFLTSAGKADYSKAVKLDPAYRGPFNNFGQLYLIAGFFAKAGKEFRKILAVDKRHPDALLGLGRLALRKRDYAAAEEFLRKALKAGQGSRLFKETVKDAYFYLAQTEFYRKRFVKVRTYIKHYCKIAPLDPQAYFLLARVSAGEKRFTEALKEFQDAFRLGYQPQSMILMSILKIYRALPLKNDIIEYVKIKLANIKIAGNVSGANEKEITALLKKYGGKS